MTKPKTQCPECKVWHDDHKNKYCDACVLLYAHIQGWDKEKTAQVCDSCELNNRRHGSKYCQECADDFNKLT